MIKWTKSTAALIAVWACVGCAEDVDSEAIRTEGMFAEFEAVSDGDGTTSLTCSLRVGGDDPGATFVRLTGDDTLTAITENEELELVHDGNGDRHYYKADLEGDDGGMQIQVSFTRGEADDNAENSLATLPQPFAAELDGLDKGAKIPRGSAVSIVWDNETSGDMDWRVNGDCIYLDSGDTADDGTLTISADDIDVLGTHEGEECEVTVVLERTQSGSTDPAFEEGGRFTATQRRVVSFISTPGPDELGGAGGATN